jgi:IclR family pca regulon transcriptional regulator
MSISLGVGSRLPVHATSLGRVLLAGLSEPELERFLGEDELPRLTPYTITKPQDLAKEVAKVREQGFALVDQELEIGLCSIAVPIKNLGCRTVAALNTSAAVLRVTPDEFVDRILPSLRRTAELISASYKPAPTLEGIKAAAAATNGCVVAVDGEVGP